MLVLRNIAFYIVFYCGSAAITLASVALMFINTDAFRRMVSRWGQFQRWCLRTFIGCHVVLVGRPVDGPILYAVKHESFFEAIDAPNLFHLPSVFAKQELFRIPGWGVAARRYGLVPVARDAGAKTLKMMIREATQLSSEGRPLVIFPEGTRTPHGVRAPLAAGFAGLYKMLKLTVVPVAVDSGPIYHRWLKQPGTITYRFGEPIPAGLPREEVEARVIAAINALN